MATIFFTLNHATKTPQFYMVCGRDVIAFIIFFVSMFAQKTVKFPLVYEVLTSDLFAFLCDFAFLENWFLKIRDVLIF